MSEEQAKPVPCGLCGEPSNSKYTEVVLNERGEYVTQNLCSGCYNEKELKRYYKGHGIDYETPDL